jgi:hypothetical protein
VSENFLYEFHEQSIDELRALGGAQYNWLKSFSVKAADLKLMTITDVEEAAKKWRSIDVPEDFYFTHGKYYKNGVAHIIDELKRKPTSHRALYSLINQDDINDSGDDPIPSFLTMQCQVDGTTLVCACTFRALEVGRFLRVNLEEIRQNLCEIIEKLPAVRDVSLSIYAFRAYLQEELHPLIKPRIEYLKDDELFLCLAEGGSENPLSYFIDLMADAQGALSVVPADRIRSLKRILKNLSEAKGIALGKEISSRLNQLLPAIDVCIGAADGLARQREIGSHGDHVGEATAAYKASIASILKILKN